MLSFVHPLGASSTILDLEDFIQSNNVVSLGSIVYVVFVTSRYGWGYDGFLEEVNTGTGLRFPRAGRIYMTAVLPLLIFSIFLWGYLG